MSGQGQSDGPDQVRPGIEVLAASGFAPLAGKKIGVITNHTGSTPGPQEYRLAARGARRKPRGIFSPEHGLDGNLDEKVASGAEPAPGCRSIASTERRNGPLTRCSKVGRPGVRHSGCRRSLLYLHHYPATPWRLLRSGAFPSTSLTGPTPLPPPPCRAPCSTQGAPLSLPTIPYPCATA